ncbi:MAG: metallophosphoesterase [Acetobacteraceae bacterium]
MAAVRVVHVSDTHLSPTHRYFAMNWAAFRGDMAASPPDLLIHGGDMAFNAPVVEADLAFAAQEMAALGVPWRAIPGNHDIGEAPPFSRLDQPVTAERVAAWTRHVGPRWWCQDVGAWRVIGLDTSLMASELPEETEQTAFFEDCLAGRGGRPVLLFIHMPPFDRDPDDPKRTTSVIPHAARGAFLDTCAAGGVKIIACGHLHVYRRLRHRGMEIVWAPPTAMVDVARVQKQRRRFPRPGYLEWTLDGTRATHRLIEPPNMFVIDMSGWTARSGGTVTTLPPWPG